MICSELAVDCETFGWFLTLACVPVCLFCINTCLLLYTLLGCSTLKHAYIKQRVRWHLENSLNAIFFFKKCCQIWYYWKLGLFIYLSVMKSFWASSVNVWRDDIWYLLCIQRSCFKAVQSELETKSEQTIGWQKILTIRSPYLVFQTYLLAFISGWSFHGNGFVVMRCGWKLQKSGPCYDNSSFVIMAELYNNNASYNMILLFLIS